MAQGTFRGISTPNEEVGKAAKRYKLDNPAACKLADALESRDDPEDDLRKINAHLERSNKPSSMVMKMVKDLKNGREIEDPKYPAAIGSYLHKQEMKKQE